MKCQSCQAEQGAVQFVTYKAANGLDVHICQRCFNSGVELITLAKQQQQQLRETVRALVHEELAKIELAKLEEGKA